MSVRYQLSRRACSGDHFISLA